MICRLLVRVGKRSPLVILVQYVKSGNCAPKKVMMEYMIC